MSIGKHITELIEEMERLKDTRTYETPDPLSVSLWEFGAEVSAMDDNSAVVLATELDITPDELRALALDFVR